jgi:hypothetical protein
MRISENRPQVLTFTCYCRAQGRTAGKYRGNNAIEAVDSDQWLVVGEPERFYLVTDH